MRDEDSPPNPPGEEWIAGERRVEENARRLLRLVPDVEVERTRDVIQVSFGGERGVVVLVTAEAYEFRLPTVEWTRGAYGGEPASRFWRRVLSDRLTEKTLKDMVTAAYRKWESEFKHCRFCGEMFPVELRDGSVCHGCAEGHLGVVH